MPAFSNEKFKNILSISLVLKGTLLTLAISLLLGMAAGFVYHFTSFPEHTMPWLSAAIVAASAFSGSFYAGREAGSRGLYHGLAVGLLFFAFVWLASILLMPGQSAPGIFYKLLLAASAGALGGIAGVGL
ncbi:MAG: TIGR04086 family membrane protein [Pelotomaculum sp.]|uniref:Hypothetical membrane protein n=1 Tax=Pelotomaculum thermopropionicum (strain DSM 13744 / JCM 10971 / SI) TaxID=370438 RepID=A5D2E3_PELTS|nr:TIGR04086 family membrane protein [Pelotomaculum sp.]BAF59585.1 hypothetical membrane protein [Pelotomaculum thermopropionicum SI]